jgi:diadenosine tetraphosphate (Ap4A) HIT family hydrolase
MNCELCVAVNEKYRLVGETELSFAIIIKWPLKPGHVIVLPKRHVSNINDLTNDEAKDLLSFCDKMKQKIKNRYKEDPLIVLNTGKHSTQDHIHFHVLPSKGGIRDLFASFEGCPKRKDIPLEEYGRLKEDLEKVENIE